MASVEDINAQMAKASIEEEENEEIFFEDDVVEDSNRFELCLVGRFLTEKSINTRAMKTKLADIWRPGNGINIKDIKPDVFLFQFYHKNDLVWVLNGGPWSFDGAMLVVNTIPKGRDPTDVQLNDLNFWIQIHGLSSGFMSTTVER